MASVNLRTIYAFAREMYPKKVTTAIQYGTAGFRTRYVKKQHMNERVCDNLNKQHLNGDEIFSAFLILVAGKLCVLSECV